MWCLSNTFSIRHQSVQSVVSHAPVTWHWVIQSVLWSATAPHHKPLTDRWSMVRQLVVQF